jgi:hypothetical protein
LNSRMVRRRRKYSTTSSPRMRIILYIVEDSF